MRIQEIINNPEMSLRYMERYLNDKSPSGYHQTTSNETSPYSSEEGYYLYSVNLPDSEICDFGNVDNFVEKNTLLLHPDVVRKLDYLFDHNKGTVMKTDRYVTPTASGRTVQTIHGNKEYIKLHYDDVLGRHERKVTAQHVIASLEASLLLEIAIKNGNLPKKLSIFREIGGRVARLYKYDKTIKELGFIIRESEPYLLDPEILYIVPCFSLFSKLEKGKQSKEIELLLQIIDYKKVDPKEYIFSQILKPIIEIYFSVLQECCLQLEAHAQNILFGFDKDFNVKKIIVRDMESIDRDSSLAQYLKKDIHFNEFQYKVLSSQENHPDAYRYRIMHSFMYDFKLGCYLIDPIIKCIEEYYNISCDDLISKLKETANGYISTLPNDFFPNENKWYFYNQKKINIKGQREYESKTFPKYR